MQIQLVIFDLGRVLIRIHDDWATAGRAVGVEVTPEQAARSPRRRHRGRA